MPPADRKRRNVHRIVEMFGSLGLPVCDDDEAIRARRDEQRGTRNRELNSTKGSVAAKAQQWFDDVNALLNRRDELLAYLYEEFCALADTVLRADLDGGRTNLGADTRRSLHDLAVDWCGTDGELAARWVGDYLVQRGLKEGGPLDKPRLVENLRAVSRSGKVQVTWSLPSSACDEVRLVRSLDPPVADEAETIVYQGAETAFLDTGVTAGQHYVYRAYTVFEGRQSLTSAVARTRRPRAAALDGKRLGVAAAVLAVAAVAGVVGLEGWQRFGHLLEGSGVREAQLAPEAQETSGTEPQVDEPVAQTAVADDDGSAVRQPSAETGAPAVPRPAAPPEASIVRPPNVAFAGHTLKIELDITESVRQALVDPVLDGVRLKRLELDGNPPSIRFVVDELAPDEFQGRASWSFRLQSEDGRTTDTITGGCVVLPGS